MRMPVIAAPDAAAVKVTFAAPKTPAVLVTDVSADDVCTSVQPDPVPSDTNL